MSLLKLVKKNIAQVIFVFAAFTMMVVISGLSVSETLRQTSVSAMNVALDETEKTIQAYLREPKIAFDSIYAAIQDILDRGESQEVVLHFLKQTTDSLSRQENGIQGFITVYGFIRGDFLFGMEWDYGDDFVPQQRPWYQLAVRSTGTNYTAPYTDMFTGLPIITLVREIYGSDNNYYGVLALDVDMTWLMGYAESLQFVEGGYGMIINQYLQIIAHPDEDMIGRRMQDMGRSYAAMADMLRVGETVSSEMITDSDGTRAIVYFKQIFNEWYISVVMPASSYYADLYRNIILLAALGFVLACILSYILLRFSAEKMKSEEDSKAKSSFLAMMSHEMRTPMNAIIGMTTIAKSTDDYAKKDNALAKINDASNHLLGIINDILDVSKIEAGKFELSLKEFCFERMLQQVINVVNYKLVEKRQNFKVYTDVDIPEYLIGDDQRLVQVITNLVGNAIKFTPEEGSIRIGTYFLGESNGVCTIKITVTDTGIGISPEHQPQLFNPFQQAESSTTRKFGGTGLGLAITKGIVEMMGGNVWIESELGKGATFGFTVKLKRSDVDEKVLMGYGVDWNGVNILVSDADKDNMMFFRKITSKYGARCDIAFTGDEAMRLISQGEYDLCLLGSKLPDMSGAEMASAIRERRRDAIIAMFQDTNNPKEVDNAGTVEGVDIYTFKPVLPSSIIDTINNALGITSKQTEAQAEAEAAIFEGRRILLVEDVEINREIVMTLLEPTLVAIVCAQNGAEAVRIFSDSPEDFDLIFMDIQMPLMDGYDATRKIRALNSEKAKTIPIIAMTANAFKEDVDLCLEAGMNDHLRKPIDFLDVLDKLRCYLHQPAQLP